MSNLCPGCGIHMSRRDGILFRTNKRWRVQVAKNLGYDVRHILELSKNTRIHLEHFEQNAVIKGVAIGMPTLKIEAISHWPRAVSAEKSTGNTLRDEIDDLGDLDDNFELPSLAIVQMTQLLLVLRHCYQCGTFIGPHLLKFGKNGGALRVYWHCRTCQKRVTWNTGNQYTSIAGATILSGINSGALVHFFSILNCYVPHKRTIFKLASKVVAPIINNYYKSQQEEIVQSLPNDNIDLDLCVDTELDNPSYNAFYCIVFALERVTKRVLHFEIFKKAEVGDNVQQAETESANRVKQCLSLMGLKIRSISTNNGNLFSRIFYTSKKTFSFNGTDMRTQLAIIHYNESKTAEEQGLEEVARESEGMSRRSKTTRAKEFLASKSIEWRQFLLREIIERAKVGQMQLDKTDGADEEDEANGVFNDLENVINCNNEDF